MRTGTVSCDYCNADITVFQNAFGGEGEDKFLTTSCMACFMKAYSQKFNPETD